MRRADAAAAPLSCPPAPQEREKEWFSAFVVGSMPQFMAYLARKRTLGEWGDDPEIQVCVHGVRFLCCQWGIS